MREDSTILRFLDRGVQGIIVPHVNTPEAAEAVARAARYWPDGHRGWPGGASSASAPTTFAGVCRQLCNT